MNGRRVGVSLQVIDRNGDGVPVGKIDGDVAGVAYTKNSEIESERTRRASP